MIAKVSLKELTRESAKVGVLGFGGPAGQIALMHRLFVEEKKWIDETRYLHALNYCMLLPGPEAQQLAVYVGWLVNGVGGGIIAGALFVLPGAVVIFALSWLYAAHGEAPAVAALFWGVKAAVVAIVAEAALRIGRRALKGRGDLAIALAAFLALFFFGAPFPLVILAAAGIGIVRVVASRTTEGPLSPSFPAKAGTQTESALDSRFRGKDRLLGSTEKTQRAPTAAAAVACAGLWLLPVALAASALGEDHVLSRVGLLFSKLAVVTFGGAYAVLAYLQQQAVEAEQWLTAAQMIDGLGLAETTPGPLVLVNQYVGFIAGWNAGGFALAIACAAMASWCTFVPSFLWIFAGAPFAERLRRNAYAEAALRSITAAVLGVVASLALWFALHVFFTAGTMAATPWGHRLFVPDVASLDAVAAGLALAAGAALIRWKANMLLVIAACAAAGIVRMLIV